MRDVFLQIPKMSLQCSDCSFQPVSELLLIKHLQEVHCAGIKEPTTFYNCKKCDYITNHRKSFCLHQTLHTSARDFPCPHCDYKASRKFNLTRHINIVHENFRYNCTNCSFNTSRKSYLLQHEQFVHGYYKSKIYNFISILIIFCLGPQK
jgi:DNA-directed RNA polymerase subunit RPC12/RpoP